MKAPSEMNAAEHGHYEMLAEFLAPGAPWTPAERWVIKWKHGLLGGFQTALAKTLELADDANLEKLRQEFPVQVDGLRAWRNGDLARRLRDAGLEI